MSWEHRIIDAVDVAGAALSTLAWALRHPLQAGEAAAIGVIRAAEWHEREELSALARGEKSWTR